MFNVYTVVQSHRFETQIVSTL